MPQLGKQLLEKVDQRLLEFDKALGELPTVPIQLHVNKKEFLQAFDQCVSLHANLVRESEKKHTK